MSNWIVLLTLQSPQPPENKAGIQVSFSQSRIQRSVEVCFTVLPAQTAGRQWKMKPLNCNQFANIYQFYSWQCTGEDIKACE